MLDPPAPPARRARGLVSSPTSGARIEVVRVPPPEPLADVVETFWAGRWDLRGETPHTTQLLADPCVNLVVEEGDAAGDEVGAARLVGIWTRLWVRELAGRGRVFGAKLHAGALRAFVDLPAHRVQNRIVPLATCFEGVDGLRQEVLSAADAETALAAFARWLAARRRTCPDASLAVALVARIRSDPSITSAEALAEATGEHLRSLQRLFREQVGASPKWVIRQNRLQEAALAIEQGRHPTLADLAAELGYADQAHLARDFRHAVGTSPSALRKRLGQD
ncbi:MAG: helix-turn-helix domain-containing protein [Polyangiaceae bacterium]